MDYDLATQRFLGDGYPRVWMNHGAGSLAAYLGARCEPSVEGGTVWFHPPCEQEPADLHLKLDPEEHWFNHAKAMMKAAIERWSGRVQVSMVDLGGNLDVVSTFRPGEQLLMDLYDQPEHVERLIWEVHEAWFAAWEQFNDILQPTNPGYSAWAGLLCSRPHYMLQCDFCYMISPDMFDRFVKPELAASCRKLSHGFYHLDGPGQLNHLDSLLEIEQLKGVQWVPGDGQPSFEQWPDVYRKIHEAGKLIQLFMRNDSKGRPKFETLDKVADAIGTADPICIIGFIPAEYEEEARQWMSRYGVE
jgi:5-methyltetrahydrofolate--homocysteine methyltransferase